MTKALQASAGEPYSAALLPAEKPVSPAAVSAAVQAAVTLNSNYVVVVDNNSCVKHVSPALAESWKISGDTLTGIHVTDLPHTINLCDAFNSALQTAQSGRSAQCGSWQSWPAPGSSSLESSYIEYCFSPWMIDRTQAGVIVRLVDQTALEQARQELVETRQRLTDFANATSDWLWEMDSELRFTWISAQLEQFYDMAREDLYGRHRVESPGTREEELAWENHLALVNSRQPFRDFVYRVKTQSGDRWARVSGVPVFNEAGTFTGYRGTGSDDTDVELMKSKAAQTETRFIRAIDEFPGSFALYDEHAKLVVYNRRYAQIHAFLGDQLQPGLSYRDCLTGQIDAALFSQPDGQPIENPENWVEQRMRQLRLPNDSVELRCSDGRWIRLALQRLPDGGCLETLVDITAQKHNELTIKEERNLLRSLIDNIPDFIYAKDTQGRFIVKNRSVSSYMKVIRRCSLGLTDEPGEHATDFDYYDASDAETFRREEIQVMEQGLPILDKEEYIHPKTAEPFWVSTTKAPLRDTEGKIIGLVGTGRHITEQKLTQARLRESHERFRDFAETAAELFWETDANLKITYVSERYQELTGHQPKAILGRHYQQAITSRVDNPGEFARVSKALDNCTSFSDFEIRVNPENNEARHIILSGKPCFDENNIFLGYRGAGRDVTKSRRLENMLQHQASHDELTQLPNRREFVSRLESALQHSLSTNQPSVLGYLDLDQFKIVNDSVGHLAGDELLLQVSNLIESQLRKTDTIARLGGDEFGVLIQNASIDNATATMERIINQLEIFRFHWNNQVFGIGVSVGLVEIGEPGIDASELMARADVACFAAKDAGRGRVQVYSPQVSDLSLQHKQLLMAAGIKDSITANRFRLYAQPIASLSSGDSRTLTIEHYEILLRLSAEDDSLILPGAFIPAAERYGLMGDIDRWVVTHTLQVMHENVNCNSEITVTINLSGQSLTDTTLADFVTDQLHRYDINPNRVCFEITETAAIRNLTLARTFIADMKKVGCTFALDDFGSGLSSFGYLKHFDVDYLKIDGSFVRDIASDATDRIMVTSIDHIGKSLGITTIAEFVENDEIIEALHAIGVDLLQGYGIGKPVEFSSVFSRTEASIMVEP